MHMRIWESSSRKVADEMLWGGINYRWQGSMIAIVVTLLVVLVVALITRYGFDQPWLSSLVSGIAPLVLVVLLYGVGWAVCAPRKQRDFAKAHIDRLEREPSVSIGEPKSDVPPHDHIWRVPVTNLGPGAVSLFAKMTQVRYLLNKAG